MVPVEAMKNKICILISMLAVGAVASTLLEETFETSSIGSISGQNNWVLDSGTGDVQTNKVNSGAQALKIQNGSVSHALSTTESEVWTRFQVFVESAPDTDPVVTAPGDQNIEARDITTGLADAGLADYSETPVDISADPAAYGVTVVEECDYTLTYVDTQAGSCPITITRTFTATDSCGNVGTDTQNKRAVTKTPARKERAISHRIIPRRIR